MQNSVQIIKGSGLEIKGNCQSLTEEEAEHTLLVFGGCGVEDRVPEAGIGAAAEARSVPEAHPCLL